MSAVEYFTDKSDSRPRRAPGFPRFRRGARPALAAVGSMGGSERNRLTGVPADRRCLP